MVPRGTVLVVDDDDAVREVAEAILRGVGFDVVVANDAAGALQVLQNGTPAVDLVITDVLLPGMDGFALAATLRKIRPTLPIIFLSGYSRADTLDGAFGPMLTKPFRADDLSAAVSRVVAGVRGTDERQ
jgi:CheY-like chemotaxis protein